MHANLHQLHVGGDEVTRPRRSLCWLYVLIALVAGLLVGRYVLPTIRMTKPLGTCVRPDGTILARSVTAAECRSLCPECTWVGK